MEIKEDQQVKEVSKQHDDLNQVKFLTLVKRESKSFESIQLCTMIGLMVLNGFGVEIHVPLRIASKSLHLFQVKEIYCNNNPINFGEIIEIHCTKQYNEEIKQTVFATSEEEVKRLIKNIKRRKEINLASLAFNTICGLVEEMGYAIEEKQTKTSKMTIQMKKVKRILKPNGEIIDYDKVYHIGKEINDYLCRLSESHSKNGIKSFVLLPNDQFINELFNFGANTSNQSMSMITQLIYGKQDGSV